MGGAPGGSLTFARLWPVGLLALGALSAIVPWFGLPAGFASVVGTVALRRPSEHELRGARLWHWAGVALSVVGLVRFVSGEAMRGIVGGGRGAVEQETVSRLRDVLFAQDAMRRAGWIDHDGDGVGSAASLEELCGGPPLRGQPARATPVLHCELAPSPLGAAARNGPYLYTVCLPTPDGGWSASGPPIDEEAAERRFVAFAWPAPGSPFDQAFFIDEHESIRVASVSPRRAASGDRFPTTCAGALALDWRPWRAKKPREGLPGDRPAPERSP